jgi:DNA relaxase NicK
MFRLLNNTSIDPDSVQESAQAPPSPNRGVQNPKGSYEELGQGVFVSVDWLAFTLRPDAADEAAALTWARELVPDEWTEEERGFRGYPKAMRNGTNRIGFGARGEVHVELTGQGLNRMRGGDSWEEVGMLREVRSRAVSISRMDVAVDSVLQPEGVSIDRMRSALELGQVATHFKAWDVVQPRRIGDRGRPDGAATLYIGSRKSDSSIRCYDKGVEGGTLPAGIWTRVELQVRDENAEAVLSRICEAGSLRAAAGVLRGMIEFKAAVVADHKERVGPAEWWERFLDGVARASLCLAKPVQTLQRAMAWLDHQVAPLLAAVVAGCGGDAGVLYDLLARGETRWRSHHRRLAFGT